MTKEFWTPERVEELKRRVAAGEKYSAIGASWGVLKNVPLAKANRMGIVHPNTHKATRGVLAEGRTTEQRLIALNRFPGASRCVYPIGDPRIEGFHFCGERTPGVEEAYCPEHHAVCWQPVTDNAMKQINYAAGNVAMVGALK